MFKKLVVAGAAAVLMAVAGAPTAMAAQTWKMPSLEGMNLQDAQDLFTETVGDEGPTLKYISQAPPAAGGVLALSMWEVCKQSPKEGRTISAKSGIAVSVNRPGDC